MLLYTHIYIYKKICFKELAYAIVGAVRRATDWNPSGRN